MAEKTQKPTQKRLRDARKRGEVAKSRELSSLGAFVASWICLWFGAAYFGRRLMAIAESAAHAADPGNGPWPLQVQSVAHGMLWILGPLLCLSVICILVIGGVQTRGLFSIVPIIPKFERINPGQGLQNLFSTRQLFEIGKMLLKTTLLLGMLFYCLSTSLHSLVLLVYAPAADLLRIAGTLVWRLMGGAALIYAVGAAADYAHQFHEFMKKQKMTVEEVRRDYRDAEGNPQIKGHRRALAREATFDKLINRLSSANLVVVNPTHFAVALHYSPGKTQLPRVVAKGVDAVALQIRAQAERVGVPVLEDPPLARRLFREVAIDCFINEGLIDVVAGAFRWARQVDRRPAQIQPFKNHAATDLSVAGS
jgi:type III secretion protein U